MPIYLNHNDKFKIEPSIRPNGGVINASKINWLDFKKRVNKRNFQKTYPHLQNMLFDPQIYCANLSPTINSTPCWYLISYPWFDIEVPIDRKFHDLDYDKSKPSEQYQAIKKRDDYRKEYLSSRWGNSFSVIDANLVQKIASIIDYQIECKCSALILPTPLTDNISSDYSIELDWIDIGLRYIKSKNIDLPIYVTIALSDSCLRTTNTPNLNPLLRIILNTVSSRKINGVYIVLEQSGESTDTKYVSIQNTLKALLYLVHIFSLAKKYKIIVNYAGPFGLALRAAGADIWTINWYKSLVRFRLHDEQSGGRAYPSYWSYPLATDIHLKADFKEIVNAGYLSMIEDITNYSSGLISSAKQGLVSIPYDWEYSPSRIGYASNHYLESLINAEKALTSKTNENKLDIIENWLEKAKTNSQIIKNNMDIKFKTQFTHIDSWYQAFHSFRSDQKI